MYDYYDIGYNAVDILSQIVDYLESFLNVISFIVFIVGVIQCFFGYKIEKFIIALSGFITGSMMGLVIGVFIGTKIDIQTVDGLSSVAGFIIFVMIISGIIGVLISYNVYQIGLFLIGFSGVYIISLLFSLASILLSGDDSIAGAVISALIPAIIAGCIVVKFNKPVIIIYTAISGAFTAAFGISSILGGGGFFIMTALSVAGIYVQCKNNDGLTEKRKLQHEDHPNTPPSSYKPLNPPYNPIPPKPVEPENNNDDIPKIID